MGGFNKVFFALYNTQFPCRLHNTENFSYQHKILSYVPIFSEQKSGVYAYANPIPFPPNISLASTLATGEGMADTCQGGRLVSESPCC